MDRIEFNLVPYVKAVGHIKRIETMNSVKRQYIDKHINKVITDKVGHSTFSDSNTRIFNI